jgi:hypothetical protein
MKKMFGMIGVAVTLGLAGGTAFAGGVNDTTVKVPFAFIVGNTELPAGEYIVKEMPYATDVMVLARTDGRELATTLATSNDADARAAKPALGFAKFDDHYFLTRVTTGEGTEREVVLTPAAMKKAVATAARNELASIGRVAPVN